MTASPFRSPVQFRQREFRLPSLSRVAIYQVQRERQHLLALLWSPIGEKPIGLISKSTGKQSVAVLCPLMEFYVEQI
jgi:hypothetical protein